jgi:hypothetical protein
VLLAVDSGTVLIAAALIAIPVAVIAFVMGAGKALDAVGKGDFAIEQEFPGAGTGPVRPASRAEREAEIRQMLEARAYRAEKRGGKPVDVDAELQKILAADSGNTGSLANDKELRQEVHDLVIARNERRERAGKEPLDVEEEIERQLRELENMGQ